jgi:hypothetical protein
MVLVAGVLSLPPPTLRTSVRLSTLKHGREKLAGAVHATDSVSADADCDDGAVVRSTRGSRRGCERATRHVTQLASEKVKAEKKWTCSIRGPNIHSCSKDAVSGSCFSRDLEGTLLSYGDRLDRRCRIQISESIRDFAIVLLGS